MELQRRIELIKRMGYSDYEAKCYLALFQKESLTVSEIARLANIPRPSAYDALEKLLAKGLCASLPGRRKRFIVTNPRFLKEKLREDYHDYLKAVDTLTDELEMLYEENRTDDNPLEYVEVLKNSGQIKKRFYELAIESKEEVLILTKSSKAHPYRFQRGIIEYVKKVLEKGVRVKCVYELWPEKEDNALMLKDIQQYVKVGEQSKIIDNLPIQLAIFDSKISMFTLHDLNPKRALSTVQVIEHPAMAEGLKSLFESMWNKAEDYETFKDKYERNRLNE